MSTVVPIEGLDIRRDLFIIRRRDRSDQPTSAQLRGLRPGLEQEYPRIVRPSAPPLSVPALLDVIPAHAGIHGSSVPHNAPAHVIPMKTGIQSTAHRGFPFSRE